MLVEGAREYSVNLEDHQIESFLKYKEVLKEWNEKINLTAIEDDSDVIIKHYIDSISAAPFVKSYFDSAKKNKISLIDIGTGAGFPGIPLKIVFENLNVTLLDSLDKRVKFLNEIINLLSLKNIDAAHGRAEDFGVKAEYREKFDIAVARAVSNLPVLIEYCLPFVKVGGIFIAMKGSNIEEVQNSKKALQVLGGEIQEIKEITLPFSDIKRNIIVIKKLRQTSTKYPRKAGKPSREPLV